MPNKEQGKPRIAVVRIMHGKVNLGTHHVQCSEGEADEQIIAKARENIKPDEHMPQDVEIMVESLEDFKPEIIKVETHNFKRNDAIDDAIKTRSDPVKFEVAKIEGSFDHVGREMKKIVDDKLFLGIEHKIFGQRLWSSKIDHSNDSWATLFVYRRKLTPEELAEKYSAAEQLRTEDVAAGESNE